MDILFWVGALKFRASDIGEAVPRERYVTMVVPPNSLHDHSPHSSH